MQQICIINLGLKSGEEDLTILTDTYAGVEETINL